MEVLAEEKIEWQLPVLTSESRLILGKYDVDKKENEIIKIPYLLDILEIKKLSSPLMS